MRYKTLYVSRPLIHGEEFRDWVKDQGFEETLNRFHVTLAYSKSPVDWDKFVPKTDEVEINSFPRSIKKFDMGATVLAFSSMLFTFRHMQFISMGATWDYPDYNPHMTITYKDSDISNIKPFTKPLLFGPETFREIEK